MENGSKEYFVTKSIVDDIYAIKFILKKDSAGSRTGDRFCRIIEGLCPTLLLSHNQNNDHLVMALSCELANPEYVSLIQASRHAITTSLESQQFVCVHYD
jgi:hypothetical protein